MNTSESLDQLLGLVARHSDLEHIKKVDDRYRRALNYEALSQPPLVVQAAYGKILELPAPWNTFQRYSYRETFEDPAAMLQNMLLDRVVPGLLLKDDSPLAIRNNHGTIQVASVLGGQWMLHENNFPWVAPFISREKLVALAQDASEINLQAGVLPPSFRTLKFYREKLAQFPPCDRAIQISLPDLQGPIDTAEQLWGSDIFLAFEDDHELFGQLCSRIVNGMIAMAKQYRALATDRLDPFANTQHGYMIPGRLLIRNDTAIMLSPETYANFVRPHDARLLKEIGTGSIHFCGNGRHLISKMLEIPDLRGLDFGQPEMMDMAAIYTACRERKVVLTHIRPSREDLISAKAKQCFPAGVVFVYEARDFNDAREVARAYYSN